MGKYPTNKVYFIAVMNGEYIVSSASKYVSLPCVKFDTYEEAEKELEKYKDRDASKEELVEIEVKSEVVEKKNNQKVIDVLKQIEIEEKASKGLDFDGINDYLSIDTRIKEVEKTPFSEFFWSFDRAGVLMILLAALIYMIFHNETRIENTGFYVSWIVCFSGIIILFLAYMYRDWNRVND